MPVHLCTYTLLSQQIIEVCLPLLPSLRYITQCYLLSFSHFVNTIPSIVYTFTLSWPPHFTCPRLSSIFLPVAWECKQVHVELKSFSWKRIVFWKFSLGTFLSICEIDIVGKCLPYATESVLLSLSFTRQLTVPCLLHKWSSFKHICIPSGVTDWACTCCCCRYSILRI